MTDLERRIIDISYMHGLSHIGSCLDSVGILDRIYKGIKPEDRVVLSNGHAGLALYCVLEKYFGLDAEQLLLKHGTHPNRCEEDHIDCSTGSLGCGLPIAVGMAMADRNRMVYCVVSDGECAEGSVWESLSFIDGAGIKNIAVYVIMNGFSAYGKVDWGLLSIKLRTFCPRVYPVPVAQKYFKGVEAHYHVLTKEEYEEIIRQASV